MNDQQPKKRVCIFCGSSANSHEHVFALRVVERMGWSEKGIFAGRFKQGEKSFYRPEQRFNTLKTRQVCKHCNNNWMNKLEAWFETSLGLLIEPTWPVLSRTVLDQLATDWPFLTKWTLKTAFIVDLASAQPTKLFDQSWYSALYENRLPSDLYIDIGHADSAAFICGAQRGFPVMNGRIYNHYQEHRSNRGFKFTLQLNHFLLRAIRCPGALPGTFDDPAIRRPFRVFPPEPRQDQASYTYKDFFEFEDRFAAFTNMNFVKSETPQVS
jgi:hypothetical protein